MTADVFETREAGKRRKALPRGERETLVLDTAERLFYAHGVHAVGMDELVRETGLSKMSVYRLFPTKDALLGAYLQRRSDMLIGLIDADIEHHAGDPRAALLSIFEAVDRDTARVEFRGCPFNNASVEFDDPAHPARSISRAYKEALLNRLQSLAKQIDPVRWQVLAAWLHLVVDGMYLSAGMLGPDGPSASGVALARKLIEEI